MKCFKRPWNSERFSQRNNQKKMMMKPLLTNLNSPFSFTRMPRMKMKICTILMQKKRMITKRKKMTRRLRRSTCTRRVPKGKGRINSQMMTTTLIMMTKKTEKRTEKTHP